MNFETRLNETQAKLVHFTEFNPDITADKLAQLTKLKSSNVAYALRRMHDEQLLVTRTIINPYALGYLDVALYFSLIDQASQERTKLFQRIIKNERVVHFGALLGDYQYLIIFLASSISEIDTVISNIFLGAGDVFSEKLIVPRTAINYFQRKFIVPTPKYYKKIQLSANVGSYEADEHDHRILSILGQQPFESLRKLAASVGLPLSTVERRVKKMEAAAVIAGFYNDLAVDRLGYQCYRLLILKKGICTTTSERLQEFCLHHRLTTYLVESVGAWDYEIGIETKNSREVSEFIEELYGVCGLRIASVKVLLESECLKCCMYPLN